MMRVFYVRCSTVEQNEARQLKMAEEQNASPVSQETPATSWVSFRS